MHTYKLILEGNLDFPKVVTSSACRELVRRLLHPAVTKRLGCLRNGGVDVRLHRWFADLNMQHLLRMRERSAETAGVEVPSWGSCRPPRTSMPPPCTGPSVNDFAPCYLTPGALQASHRA